MRTSVFGLCVLSAGIGLALAGCDELSGAPAVKNNQAVKAQAAAQSITFTDNAEIDNIKARIELTSKPGQLGFIMLLNETGQPVLYEAVKGKITSGSKRLTQPFSLQTFSNGNGGRTGLQLPAPSDEGTWGQSGDYIFYWAINGEYRQWNGKYLYSDKPFRLSVEPLVISTSAK